MMDSPTVVLVVVGLFALVEIVVFWLASVAFRRILESHASLARQVLALSKDQVAAQFATHQEEAGVRNHQAELAAQAPPRPRPMPHAQ